MGDSEMVSYWHHRPLNYQASSISLIDDNGLSLAFNDTNAYYIFDTVITGATQSDGTTTITIKLMLMS